VFGVLDEFDMLGVCLMTLCTSVCMFVLSCLCVTCVSEK